MTYIVNQTLHIFTIIITKDIALYPLIFDSCRRISKKYLAIDIFWNPSRLGPGEFTKIGSVNWYGSTYEELGEYYCSKISYLLFTISHA
jgi:hypothetical protein